MTPMVAIGVISQVLTLCGLVSIRMFLPGFLYFLALRLAVEYPRFAPELVAKLASQTPAWQISWPFLAVLCLLACAELAAVRNPDVKQFLVEDLDRYVKPVMAILLALGVINAAQSQEVHHMMGSAAVPVQTAAFGGIWLVLALAAGGMTGFCCQIRAMVLEKLQMIDPDDSLHLQSISNCMGEAVLIGGVLLVLFAPLIALVLTVCSMLAGFYFKRLWDWYENQHTHSCAACAAKGVTTQVANCALICPACGAEQPDVRQVGWFGFSSTARLDGMPPEKHAFRLLASHRCRWCAAPLDGGTTTCGKCNRPQWADSFDRYYVRRTDIRCAVLMMFALVCSIFPLGGLVLTLILFRPLAVRPMAVHLGGVTRFFASFMAILLKLLLLVPLVILSFFPVVGALAQLPFLIRYGIVRRAFLRRVKK